MTSCLIACTYMSFFGLRRFEAGTPAIAEAIGLGAACDYLTHLGMENVAAYEKQLGTYLYERVRSGAVTHIA